MRCPIPNNHVKCQQVQRVLFPKSLSVCCFMLLFLCKHHRLSFLMEDLLYDFWNTSFSAGFEFS